MTVDEFEQALKNFLSDAYPADKEVRGVELQITLQPNMTVMGGHLILAGDTETPIDLRQLGKSKCRQFVADIEAMHRLTANSDQNKWNKASFTIDSKGHVTRKFIWDAEFEMENLNAYPKTGELTRQKWHWEK